MIAFQEDKTVEEEPFSCTVVGAARDYFMNFVSAGRAFAVCPTDGPRHNKYMSLEFIIRIEDLCLPYGLLETSVMLGKLKRIMFVFLNLSVVVLTQ